MYLARIGDNHFGPFSFGPIDSVSHQGMSHRGIGSDDENAVGILYFRDGVRHRSTSESGGKTCHR